jgi:hypothetical protein
MVFWRIDLADDLAPVEVALNVLPRLYFVEAVTQFFAGVGSDYNDSGITFPGENPDLSKPEFDVPEGLVEFYVMDQEVWIPHAEAVTYVRMAVRAHLGEHPEDRAALGRFLDD